jgi:hypothetical protein
VKASAAKKLRDFADALAGRQNYRGNHDVVALAHLQAGLQSATFYAEELLGAREFDDHVSMLQHAVGLATVDGQMLEFGVATGRTINVIADEHRGPIFGFDSFKGLPESWYGKYQRGTFARNELPTVRENVTLVSGWFSDTLPAFLAEHSEPVSFLHIDCDLYSSTSFVLTQLQGRIIPGTVILFDEYFNYPGWRQHEHRAFVEFIDATGLSFRYDSFLHASQPVCVVIGGGES